MKTKTIKQILIRTLQLKDKSFLKFGIEEERELDENEDSSKCKTDLFNECREQMNAQSKILLKK